jgi:hypothetical protein
MARKLERLIYTNERGESIEFSRMSVYHINPSKQVTGLSDVRNMIYSINAMGQDGDTYIGNRIESREIEIAGSINERKKDLVLECRRRMNRIFNPQYAATLTYVYGDFRRVIDCKVDNAPVFTCESIFIDFTIQLLCPNPFWRKESKERNDIATWTGLFEFPAEIPIDEGWEIGYREPSLIVNVFNEGDVRTGILVEFRAVGGVVNPTVMNIDTQEFIKINLTMIAGDILTVNTSYGEKEVKVTRNGVTTDAFRYLDADSTYLQLKSGDNLIRYSADGSVENLEVTIYHDDLYLGV